MTPLFPYDRWKPQLPSLSQKYRRTPPYPHIILDPFLEEATARSAAREFPGPNESSWIQYKHFNENKIGKSKREEFPPLIGSLVDEFNSPEFLLFLSELTGIQNLIADPLLNGGGMHQTQRNGFLNMHVDFTTHHHQPWRRRVNLIFFLNEGWKEEWKGWLEMWDKGMKSCVDKALPTLNKAVIFNTDEFSYHGVPERLQCPPDQARKSLALYYYTLLDKPALKLQSTQYVARPVDVWKAPLIWLDTKAVYVYSLLKRKFALSDDWTYKFLRFFRGKK